MFMDAQKDFIISTKNLCKSFSLESGFFSKESKKVYAVDDVNLLIPRGSTYGLAGESGCGKSTTAKCLVKMFPVTSGQIIFKSADGQEYDVTQLKGKKLKSYREKIKYIFQDPSRSLNPRMNVLQILTDGLKHSGKKLSREQMILKAQQIIQLVGLDKRDLYRKPNEFSGGQRQRISIARALIMECEFIICDEVVSALDVSIQGQVLNLLCELRKKLNLSILFIAHDLKVTCYFCDRIGVMYRGVMVEEAPAKDFDKNCLHPYTKLLFETVDSGNQFKNVEVKTMLQKEDGCPYAHRCLMAQEICCKQKPELREISENHFVRCFFCSK